MTISTLKDLYIDQLQDLYSANRQALQVTRELHDTARSNELRKALSAGAEGIEEGMDQLKSLIENHDANPRGEHCKGMEGLVAEAPARMAWRPISPTRTCAMPRSSRSTSA